MTLLNTISTDIKSHLLSIIVVVLLIAGSVYGVDALTARHDAKTESKYELLLSQATAKSTADEQAYQNTLIALNAQNITLSQQVSSSNAALAVVLKKDASLNANQVAGRLGGTATSDNTISLPLVTSRNVLAEVDELPVVRQNLVAETTIATNLTTELNSQTKVVTDLNSQIVAETQSCKAEITAVKAQGRRSKVKWFIAGFVSGFIAREVIKP